MIINKRIPLKYPLQLVIWDLLYTLIFSIVIHLFSDYLFKINLPIGIAAFMGTAISLVLSFKLSQSYDRWWEARKIWGAIVNDSRSLVIQAVNFSKSGKNSPIVRQIAYRQIAWCYALTQHLRKIKDMNAFSQFLDAQELSVLTTKNNIPVSLINSSSADVKTLLEDKEINEFQQVQLDSTLVRLTTAMGMAERIKNTVFPKSYRLTLHLFIYLFLIILSFSLIELKGFLEIPVLVGIALPFFLLEKIALKMQDPFENKPSDTAMTTISRSIEINIRQLLDEEDVPEPYPPNKFYSL